MDARPRWTRPAQAAQARPGARARIGRVLSEPLLHFLVLGVLILLAAQAWRTANDERRIVVTDETVAALAGKHRLQYGRPPAPAEQEALVRAWVDEEILYREGRALGLDRDDEIVRRRIAQKVQFLREDLAIPPEPSEAELRAHFAANSARYASPPRTSFRHLYFSPDAVGAERAQARAQSALARLRAGSSPQAVGADAFPDRDAYVALSPDEAERVFGRSALAQALASAPEGRWTGPLRSGYGWHLVLVQARVPGAPADFAAVREQVRGDYLAAARAAANRRAFDALRDRYTVVRRDGGGS
jgi:peptidyl-prolyl cis-trans isomerase C